MSMHVCRIFVAYIHIYIYIYLHICVGSQVRRPPPNGMVLIWGPARGQKNGPQNHRYHSRLRKKVGPERAPEGRNRAPNQPNQRHEGPEPQRRRERGAHQRRKQAKMTKISATRALRPQRGRGSTTEGARRPHRGGDGAPQRGCAGQRPGSITITLVGRPEDRTHT